jgi:hypothetical protein
MSMTPLLALLLLAGPQSSQALRAEIDRLEARVTVLDAEVLERDELLGAVRDEMRAVRAGVEKLIESPPRGPAAAFLAGPANGSDRFGVARAAVFAPRIEVESPVRHDTIYLTVKRVETASLKTIATVELTPDLGGVDLPLDENGALYLVEWETSEGHVYNLVLRDGASLQPAASVSVTEYESRGLFAFVGYRVE